MAKYEFDLSVGIKEVLDADSAKKVESQIEAQKKKFKEPIDLTLNISDAKKRFKELEKEAKKVQKSLDKALSAKNFDGISQYTKQMSNIQKEQTELLSIIGDQTKAITQQSDAIKAVETAEKRRKKTVDNITAATEDTVSAIKEQAEAINQVAKAEAKLNRARKPKTSTKKDVEATKNLVDTTENVIQVQDKAAKTQLRTQAQVNAELDKELQKLKEIEAQQHKNELARSRLQKEKENYGKEVLGYDKAVYDTDLLRGAKKEIEELNELLNTRNKFQEKYIKLCNIVEKYYIDDKPGKYSIGNGMYKNLDQFFDMNKDIQRLEKISESGQKTTNKEINGLFKDIIRGLQSDAETVARMINSGEVFGDTIGQRLDKEEIDLNKETQRLHEERQAQLSKINALREEELELIKRAGQEEAKNAGKFKFANGTMLNEAQTKAVEKYCSILKKKLGEAYDEATHLKNALELVFNIQEGNVSALMDRFHSGNPASNAVLKTLTGMDVNNQKNRDLALRSINPDAYDKILADQREAAEKAKAELKSQKSDFQKQWDELVSVMIGGDAFKNETNLTKGKILKSLSQYGKTASEAIDEINKAWIKGDLEGKSGKTKWVQAYLDHLNTQREYIESIRSAKAGDLDVDSLFGFGGSSGITEEKLKVLKSEVAAWDELIAKKKEYYGIETVVGEINVAKNTESVETTSNIAQVIEANKKLVSSYEGLAEAVEKYVTSSKQLWEAYDKGKDFDKFADERNAAIEQIVSHFPNGDLTPGSSASMYLQSQEMSRTYASNGTEAALADIENKLTKAKEEQVHLAQEAEAAALAQAEAEKNTAEAARQAAEAKERQAAIAEKATNASNNVSAEELIARDVNKALEQLRSAKNNETTLFSLKGVFDGEDLVIQAQNMVENIAEQANLSLGKFNVKDDIVKVQLYNKELQVTVDQMYKLRAATEDMESAQLELISQSFSQNVKALNENTFDTDGIQQRALASIEKVRSSLHGLEYDLTDLENAARNISSQDDFTKFSNQLKAAQDNIQAIKNSTVSKNSMNPLANMQRDMQNANIEIETMRLKLEKFGDIQGVAEAKKMLTDMADAAKQYNDATNAQGQQNAYNQYSNLRSSFKAHTEYINAAKALNDSQKSEEKKTDPIREQYQSILDLVNKINVKSTEITKYQTKDGGSGMFAGYIQQLQSEKARLVSELKGITDEINNTLGSGFVQGKEFSVPFASFLDDSGAISSFLNDTRTQASLTTEEIEKLVVALQKSQNIDVQAASKVAEQFKSVQETYNRLSALTGLDKGNENYQALVGVFGQIMQYKKQLSSDPTSWTPEESTHLQTLIDQFTKYGNALAEVGEKEARYFAGKQKYTQGTTYGSALQNVSEETQQLNDIRKQLETAAKSFAKDSGAGDAFITGFTQSADGISRLDFSVFDAATGSLRNFRMEMGSVTEGMYVTETTINKSLANIQAAQKQLQSVGNLLGRLDASGVNVGEGNASAQVAKLLEMYKQLSAEISKGDNADQNKITKLTKDLKLASSETEKFYKQMLQMESAIASGQAKDLGIGDPKGDVYGQLVNKTKELVGTQQNATLEFGRFDKATNTLNASLVHANGTVENFQVQMNGLNGQMTAQQSGVTKLTTSWDVFKSSVMRAGKRLMTALVGYNVFFKVVSEVRKGIGYVKEIDLALTELKKVTDETEESYKKFLNTAAGTAGEIGSTVSDFTEATANFARLGYTMEESAKMAETAIVYKNVADGLDTVEAATDSIISTMKAFGIESDDTMGIIDRFNEVKFICLLIW